MAADPGTYLRLKAAIDATIDRIDEKSMAAKALSDAYAVFRGEALLVAKAESVQPEFDRLFPAPKSVSRPTTRGGYDPIAAASDANEGLALLARLSGWLDGFERQLKFDAVTSIYARARSNQDDGNGAPIAANRQRW